MMTGNAKNPSSSSASSASAAAAAAAMMRPPEQGIKCPRCDSSNTKFCYYNNYSLSQPRHFCKTCRRYWTKGGALRNVPVGGGCRKSKKSKSSSSCSSSVSAAVSASLPSPSSCSAGLASSASPNFQLHGLIPAAGFIGYNYPIAAGTMMGCNDYGGYGGIASSIESLSSMNQDLHWKLQQQRLAMLFGGGNDHQSQSQQQHHQPKIAAAAPLLEAEPISFHAADHVPKTHDGTTAWFLEGAATANYSGSARINCSSGSGNGNNDINNVGSDWNGMAPWSDMSQFSALP